MEQSNLTLRWKSLVRAFSGPLLIVLFATGLYRASQNAAQTTLSLIAHDVLHIGPSLIGIAVTIAGLTSAGASLLIAGRLRSHQLKGAILASLLLGALSIGLYYIASNVIIFIAASVTIGISGGLAMPTLATLATTSKNISPARGVAAYTAALSASLAVGPLYETFILKSSHENVRIALMAFMPFPIIGFILILFGIKAAQNVRSTSKAKGGSLQIRQSIPIRLAISAQLLYQAPFVAVVAFGALIARYSFGASSSTAQLGFTIFFVLSFASRVILLWKPDILPPTRLLKVSALLTLIGVTMLALMHGEALLIVSMALLGIPHGVTYPVSLALLAKWTSQDTRTQANAALSSVTSFVGVLLPFILGLLAASFGYRVMVGLVLIPVLVLAVPVFQSSEERLATQATPA